MSITKILVTGKKIQSEFLDFIDSQDEIEEKYKNLIITLDEINIRDNSNEFRSFLYLISTIINNHNRSSDFFSKIERIIINFKEEIQKYYSNLQIFDIFKDNKRILLFLIQEKILILDENILDIITQMKYLDQNYPQYLAPEIKPLITQEMIKQNEAKKEYLKQPVLRINISALLYLSKNWIDDVLGEIPENFEEKRKIGENDELIFKLIREDNIDEFISYVNQTNYPIKNTIKSSIYETNLFLLKNSKIDLIEYASFFGSIQIFKYLALNGSRLNSSIWEYAIHGRHPEIIHLLEEKNIKPSDETYKKCLVESIKCHHNEIKDYIESNYIQNPNENNTKNKDENENNNNNQQENENNNNNQQENENNNNQQENENNNNQHENLNENDSKENKLILSKSLKYHNFYCIEDILINESTFCDLCKFDYVELVKVFLETKKIDVNYIKVIWKKIHTYRKLKQQKTALFLAIEKENIEIIKLLLNNIDIDVNIINKWEAGSSSEDEEEKIYDGDDYTGEDKTALYLAVQKRNTEIVELLLSNENIDVNIMNKKIWYRNNFKQETALFTAVENEDIEIIKLLLMNEKIDVNIINGRNAGYGAEDPGIPERRTALYLAVKKSNVEIVKLLVENKNIDINIICTRDASERAFWPTLYEPEKFTREEKTALYLAVENEKHEIVRLLLTNDKVDVNILNKSEHYEYKQYNDDGFPQLKPCKEISEEI